MQGTLLLSPSLGAWPDVGSVKGLTELLVERGTVLDVAVARALKGEPCLGFPVVSGRFGARFNYNYITVHER